jgi:hypothetical protein
MVVYSIELTQKRFSPAAAWYFHSFVGHFFALLGEKLTYQG